MDSSENAGPRQSRIPHPRSAAVSGLQELSEAQHNSRIQPPTALRKPVPTGIKRPGADLQPQPETKRQTLAERAADYSGKRSVVGLPAPPAAPSGVRPASIVTLASLSAKTAQPANAFARSTRTAANGPPRAPPLTSGGHLGQSVGPGASHAFKQSVGPRRRPAAAQPRPATAMDQCRATDPAEDPSTSEEQKNVLDVDERVRSIESEFLTMKDALNESLVERKLRDDILELANQRANDLQRQRDQLEEKNASAQNELGAVRQQLQSSVLAMEGERREHAYRLEDQAREHRRELDDVRREHKDGLERLQRDHKEALDAMERHCRAEQEEERGRTAREIQELKASLGTEQQGLRQEIQGKDSALQQLRATLGERQSDLDRERALATALQRRLADASATNVELEERVRTLQAQVDFLQSDNKQQSDQYSAMEARMQHALKAAEEARQKLIKEETERRILFNKYQELKGNIRVMCRVRPAIEGAESDEAKIAFPDAKTSSAQIDITGPEERNSLGVASRKTIPFEFDRVFAPGVRNDEVFDEIAQLVQSALDGYNVCIFCYGQTGSGKTYTMSSADGVIPRATHMIYDSIKQLEEKSWTYTMEGSFVEVYNEELHDLLSGPTSGKEQETRKKLEIRHDEARKTTAVVHCKTVRLDSSDEVESMLRLAQSNRSVAATKANERSSRSHSIFILKLVGENAATGERCEGTLNLVDLAGSERLKQSGAEGDRKKETQNINKSLACLGDVIEALGRGAPHIPYRNSKLTHLLQYSLGGNSKTLMFVMVSPLEAHLKETITSLRFATKVHNTHIGTAKSTKKTKDRASDA